MKIDERIEILTLRELKKRPLSFWELVRNLNISMKKLESFLSKALDSKILKIKDDIFYLTEKGLNLVNNDSRFKELNINEEELKNLFKEWIKYRPPPEYKYYQGYVAVEDLIKKMKFMHKNGDLAGRNIVLLGDDDFFSLILAYSKLPYKITVIEIDERLLDALNNISKKYYFNIELIKYNACDPIPQNLTDKYHIFVSEPVETVFGLSITLSRACDLLKEGGAVYFGLSSIESSYNKWFKIQKIILDMNFVITDILKKFSWYPETEYDTEDVYDSIIFSKFTKFKPGYPKVNWFNSALIRLEAIGKPKPLLKGKFELDEKFYFDEEMMTF